MPVHTTIELCPNCGHTFQMRSLQSMATPSRLRENFAPLDAERATAQDIIATAETELQRCEAEISRLEPVIQGLNAEKNRLNTIVSENKSLLSPIRRLPVELLSAIFELCLPVDKDIKEIFLELNGTLLSTSFAIATTCHLWRQIATSSPSLWSKIVLDLDAAKSRTADALNIFLHRSANHNLHIYLKLTEEWWPDHDVTSLLVENASRISLLRLWGKSDPFQDFPLSSLQFPRLQTFGFTFSGDADNEEQDPDPFPWLASASRLSSVLLNDVGMLPEFLNGIPNERIQFLGTFDASTSQTFQVLRRFSDAREGWIQVQELDDDIQGNIILSNMQTLTIYLPSCLDYETSALVVIPFLTCLTLPSLSTLRVVDDNTPEHWVTWDITLFESFISRSGLSTRLTTLDLRGNIPLDEQLLIKSLELLPAITRFVLFESIDRVVVGTLLLSRLAVDNSDSASPRCLLPALADFQLRLCDHLDRLPLLVSIIKSRSPLKPQTVAALQQIWVILVSMTGKENVADLIECRTLGVRVHAEVVSHAERDAWVETDAARWDSTFGFL